MARKRSHFWLLLFCLFLPLAVGLLAGSLTRQQVASYATMPKPSFAPPGIVFPIVWNILYLLMGYSSYLVAPRRLHQKARGAQRIQSATAVQFLLAAHFLQPASLSGRLFVARHPCFCW